MKARLPGHGTVVAYLALFVTLGGTSYAAVTLSNNSVKSKHIANGQVKRADIRNNAVNSAKVADGSLLSGDFAPGQLPGAGPAGPKGDKGDPGADGNANVTSYSLGGHNFATAASLFKTIDPGISEAEYHQSAWAVHLRRASGNIYPIPGPGVNGTSQYRVFVGRSGTDVNLTVTRSSGTGEEYVDVRVTRVAASDSVVVP